jgi:ankyrin repeat protein
MKIPILFFLLIFAVFEITAQEKLTPERAVELLQEETNKTFSDIDVNKVMEYVKAGGGVDVGGESPVIDVVAAKGTVEDMTLLLKKGGKVNPKNKYLDAPIFKAIEYKNMPVIKMLVLKGADLARANLDGYTPLEYSIVKKDTAVFNVLNIKGGNYNVKRDASILYETSAFGDTVLTKFLIRKGATLLAYEVPDWFGTELGKMKSLKDHDRMMVAIKSADKISILNSDGTAAIHIAAYLGDIAMINLCLKRHESLNTTDYQKNNALHYALANSQNKCAKFLLESGINFKDANSEGGIACTHLAAITGNLEMLKELVKRGSSVSFTDWYGINTLTYGILGGNPAVVKFLLESGADPGERDKESFTPRHFAAFVGNIEILEMVMKNYDPNTEEPVNLLEGNMYLGSFNFGPTENYRMFNVPNFIKPEIKDWLRQKGVKPPN